MAEKRKPEPETPRPRYRWTLLRAGRLLLDGGGMFGVVPRVVWTRFAECDDRNRVELHHNCLLLEAAESADGAAPGTSTLTGKPPRYLIEAGTGDKLDAKMREIFGLDGRTVEAAVREAGVDPAEIEAAVVSHMHFDHAGGLTRRVRDGETPDWEATKPGAASGDDPRVKLTFPNAELIVQRREWQDARNNDAVMTRTYYRDHILPFEDRGLALQGGRERLRLVESERPFPLNRKPGRGELPKGPVTERMTEVLPGVFVFLVPGHTWGQQAMLFEDVDGRTVVFTPDVLPTAWHAGAAFSLSYDVEPYTSMITKHWLLSEAVDRDWLLVLDHEPGNPCRRVRRDGDKGWFTLEPDDEAAAAAGLGSPS